MARLHSLSVTARVSSTITTTSLTRSQMLLPDAATMLAKGCTNTIELSSCLGLINSVSGRSNQAAILPLVWLVLYVFAGLHLIVLSPIQYSLTMRDFIHIP